jgi:hypothetical protein
MERQVREKKQLVKPSIFSLHVEVLDFDHQHTHQQILEEINYKCINVLRGKEVVLHHIDISFISNPQQCTFSLEKTS